MKRRDSCLPNIPVDSFQAQSFLVDSHVLGFSTPQSDLSSTEFLALLFITLRPAGEADLKLCFLGPLWEHGQHVWSGGMASNAVSKCLCKKCPCLAGCSQPSPLCPGSVRLCRLWTTVPHCSSARLCTAEAWETSSLVMLLKYELSPAPLHLAAWAQQNSWQKWEDLLNFSNSLYRSIVRTSLLSFWELVCRFPTCAETDITTFAVWDGALK